ncbi:MAG: class I SAM-dependent methyltransferase [Steroidobacteraceae bacterium]
MPPQTQLGLQKVCDIHDFFHPEIDHILRRELKSVPFGSRRAWEFAMIFRALQKKGKLRGDAEGLAMGAGTERLIYSIARIARRTVVTDLYLPDRGWVGVRTTNPRQLVMSKAPWPIDDARIEVLAMDMRDLTFPDDSFDFCWSTGAFEHIGDDGDFRRHFSEVHRVLRPGGVYAFTTAVVFGPQSLRIPHNHYFHPQHLIDLLHESPLHAEPEFDCRVTDHLFNRPHIERFQDYGFPAGQQISKPVISFRRGALLAANVMVLTKDPARPKQRPAVIGFDRACSQLRRRADSLVKHMWQRWQVLLPEPSRGELVVQPQYFGSGKIAIDVMFGPGAPRRVQLAIKSRRIDEFRGWHVERRASVGAASSDPIAIGTVDSRIYCVTIRGVPPAQADRVLIRAMRLDGSADVGGALTLTGKVSTARRSLRERLALVLDAFS